MPHPVAHATLPHSHPHGHHHGHMHGGGETRTPAVVATPSFSLLRASLALRLAVALALSCLIWLAVYAVVAVPA